ncbi:hypothetical protein ACFU76_36710 [Streptomyces sp. NPDC057539]|uniref:hypothetical protein n=1 Tax=Streptomyces sp. NPDC057539 TaxID=3346159 RepID=UPI003688B83D
MTDTGPGVWSGWRSKEIRITGAGERKPVPLEIRGGFTSTFLVQPVRSGTEGRDTGGFLLVTSGGGPHRVVLPPEFDSLLIGRQRVGSEGASGFHRWKVRVLSRSALPALSSETVEGEKAESFTYSRPAGETRPAVLHYEFQGRGDVIYCPGNGQPPKTVRTHTYEERAGTLPLSREGYVTVVTSEKWKVSITP